jgi:hypothetical protein
MAREETRALSEQTVTPSKCGWDGESYLMYTWLVCFDDTLIFRIPCSAHDYKSGHCVWIALALSSSRWSLVLYVCSRTKDVSGRCAGLGSDLSVQVLKTYYFPDPLETSMFSCGRNGRVQ